MTAEALLERLDGVRSRGPGRWSARCPAHEDRSPSLSIADGERGILLRCFAGCEARGICQALGLFHDAQFDPDGRRRRDDRRRAREREREANGRRLDALREAENLIRSARDLDLSDIDVDRALERLGDAHDLLRREMGEEEYARFCHNL
jgi:hypothetical protein